MVKLHVKKGDENQFLYETTVTEAVDDVTLAVTAIYNGRLKINRICSEMEELSKHGTMLPPDMMGLTDEQLEELKLSDDWGGKCVPSGGWTFNRDPIGRRNGHQPSEHMQEVITKTINEAKTLISKKQIDAGVCVTQKMVQEGIDMLRGVMMIVYPMNLPPHDVIQQEFDNTEDLSGTQASLEVIDPSLAQLWFSGKEMQRGKKLSDYLGKNEKTKVIVKVSKMGQGAPAREPVVGEEERKQMMLHQYRRQEELKKLEQDGDDHYLDSAWADSKSLKRSFQGLSDVSWRPK
uniref:Cilia- and flagella-associated protein 298 n=1 Tax=Graphocephala atropunctata TaxID=36148 RepID=A0A1B6MUW1_9HEMI